MSAEPCITTTYLGEVIEVFRSRHGHYFFECGDEFVTWSSLFDFAEPLEALSICIFHQECSRLDRTERPAAIFSIEGKILHTNKPHRQWLGHGCIQAHRDSVLSRVVSPEQVSSKILAVGNRLVGMYQISNAPQPYKFNIGSIWDGAWESATALNGFARYSSKSQEVVSRWVDLGDTPEFCRQYVRDLEALDELRRITH